MQSNPATATATSDGDGTYNLITGAGTFGLTVTGTGSWTTPQPIQAVVPNDQTVVPLTITLRPPTDIIQNGDFENQNLANWSHTITQTNYISANHRSGSYSLCISNTVQMTQTGLISNVYEPTLGFWYKMESGDGDDLLTAEFLGTDALTTTSSFSTTTVNNSWHYTWLDLALTQVYTGPIGVRFHLDQTGATPAVVCVDEVSIGGAWGGPNFTFLPVIFKN